MVNEQKVANLTQQGNVVNASFSIKEAREEEEDDDDLASVH